MDVEAIAGEQIQRGIGRKAKPERLGIVRIKANGQTYWFGGAG